MSGWDKKFGEIYSNNISEDELWSLFNYVFSDSCAKRNTYKFGLIKAILDNLFYAILQQDTALYYISYENLFGKFAENYWNLVVKYHLRQMIATSRSQLTYVETLFSEIINANPDLQELEFSSIDPHEQTVLIKSVTRECKKYVLGALYTDLEGKVYSFNLSEYDGIYLSPSAFDFLTKYRAELEKINYYSWAKFLEKVNADDALIRVIDKLDLATPVRKSLDVYRAVLQKEFEENTCFYCGRKLASTSPVDHVIPWKFMKTDNLWNLVLVCPKCNSKKNDRLPSQKNLNRIIERNHHAKIRDAFIEQQFKSYDPERYKRLWEYAQMSGYKVMKETC